MALVLLLLNFRLVVVREERKGSSELVQRQGTTPTSSVSLVLCCVLQYKTLLFVNTPSTFSSLGTSNLLCSGL